MADNNNEFLSIHDTEEHKAFFDVMICSVGGGENLATTEYFAEALENNCGFKCFYKERDAISAGGRYTIQARLIEERCRKFLVLLSHELLESEECSFQVNFAHCLSPDARDRRIIPVKIETGIARKVKEKLPVLRITEPLDWTDDDQRKYFWHRLTKTISQGLRDPPNGVNDVVDPRRLSTLAHHGSF